MIICSSKDLDQLMQHWLYDYNAEIKKKSTVFRWLFHLENSQCFTLTAYYLSLLIFITYNAIGITHTTTQAPNPTIKPAIKTQINV